jgi:hypothetical protein
MTTPKTFGRVRDLIARGSADTPTQLEVDDAPAHEQPVDRLERLLTVPTTKKRGSRRPR